jgi:hypothetical protein
MASYVHHVRRKRMSDRMLIAVFLILFVLPCAQAQQADFGCDSATLFVNRLSIVPREAVLGDSRSTKVLASQDFFGFAKYGIDSVKLTIRFDADPDSSEVPRPTGSIRVRAVIRSAGKSSESEIRYSPDWRDPHSKELAFLRARLTSPDPASDDPGSPAIRIRQAETGLPVFLIKFIGVVAAGGRGDVDSHDAMVVDFRGGHFSMPVALGCIDNDFAGQEARGGSANCQWNHAHLDYACATSDGDFFLISGKRVVADRKRETGKKPVYRGSEISR